MCKNCQEKSRAKESVTNCSVIFYKLELLTCNLHNLCVIRVNLNDGWHHAWSYRHGSSAGPSILAPPGGFSLSFWACCVSISCTVTGFLNHHHQVAASHQHRTWGELKLSWCFRQFVHVLRARFSLSILSAYFICYQHKKQNTLHFILSVGVCLWITSLMETQFDLWGRRRLR